MTHPRGRKISGADKCRRKFLRFFPRGFADDKYFAWERGYKWNAHEQWNQALNRRSFRELLKAKRYAEVATTAIRIESRTNLLFSFEKMALRDAVRTSEGAEVFASGLYELLHVAGKMSSKFERWCDTVGSLPKRQTRVLTHPAVTVFPFIAQPDQHIFLKPNVTKTAAREYGFDFTYKSQPSWEVYLSLLKFAEVIQRDLIILQPRDMMDIQSFIWVLGSDEYH